jgi:hypothetical protein
VPWTPTNSVPASLPVDRNPSPLAIANGEASAAAARTMGVRRFDMMELLGHNALHIGWSL